MDSGVTFVRPGEESIHTKAKWDNKPFTDSIYYSLRWEKWRSTKAWGLELVHHKLYLANPPAEITHFSVSDGYNLIYVNRSWLKSNHIFRVGAGPVLAHPDILFADETDSFWRQGGLFSGFYLSGVSVQFSYERWLKEFSRHFVNLEFKTTFSYARVPIDENTESFADVPNIAFHILLGIGSKPLPDKSVRKKIDYAHYWWPIIAPATFGLAVEG